MAKFSLSIGAVPLFNTLVKPPHVGRSEVLLLSSPYFETEYDILNLLKLNSGLYYDLLKFGVDRLTPI